MTNPADERSIAYADRAEALFTQGFNCAQAVLGAYATDLGMDTDTAMRVAASLGGGLAHTGEVCGAALGMLLALGLAKGYSTADPEAKAKHNTMVRQLMVEFRNQFGNTGCDALRDVNNRAVCIGYVRYAAQQVARALD